MRKPPFGSLSSAAAIVTAGIAALYPWPGHAQDGALATPRVLLITATVQDAQTVWLPVYCVADGDILTGAACSQLVDVTIPAVVSDGQDVLLGAEVPADCELNGSAVGFASGETRTGILAVWPSDDHWPRLPTPDVERHAADSPIGAELCTGVIDDSFQPADPSCESLILRSWQVNLNDGEGLERVLAYGEANSEWEEWSSLVIYPSQPGDPYGGWVGDNLDASVSVTNGRVHSSTARSDVDFYDLDRDETVEILLNTTEFGDSVDRHSLTILTGTRALRGPSSSCAVQ